MIHQHLDSQGLGLIDEAYGELTSYSINPELTLVKVQQSIKEVEQ